MRDDGMLRDDRGLRPCAWCGGPINQPPVGRLRDFCRRHCRQRAYEARREQLRIVEAVDAAMRSDPSRDGSGAVGDQLTLWVD